MPLNIGALRTRLQVQVPVRLQDSQNSLIVQWAVLRNASFAIMPITDPASNSEYRRQKAGEETNFAASRLPLTTHLIYCRQHSVRLTPEMRLVNFQNNVVFNIVEATELQQIRGYVRLIAKESAVEDSSVSPLWACVVDSNGSFAIDADGDFGVTLL